nr:host cell division inhibitor Icd-like protein [Proteus mirabilis]
MIDIAKFNSAIGWVKNYTKIFREYLVKLRVTNRYAQKKKDSVQAVLIQPNNIGLVQYFLSSIGGWDLMCVRLTYGVQPLGSMPRDCSSLRRTRLIHVASDVSPSFFISDSSCSLNSCGSRIWYWSVFVLSLDIVITILVLFELCNYNVIAFILQLKKQNPAVLPTLTGLLTTMLIEVTIMAMYKSTQTHPKFLWRFFSCQQSKYFSVEATSEQEARSMLPDSPCLFSARIRKEVAHG